MPRKKSVKKVARAFTQDIKNLLAFVATVTEGQAAQHVSWIYEMAIIRLYRAFEDLVLHALVGAINNDTATLSAKTGFEFPKHLTDEVCEFMIVGNGYFDFRGRDGLIKTIKKYVPDDHYIVEIIKRAKYKDALERLSALRNLSAHSGPVAKRAALAAVQRKRIGSAGAWLKTQDRFTFLCAKMHTLASELENRAPY